MLLSVPLSQRLCFQCSDCAVYLPRSANTKDLLHSIFKLFAGYYNPWHWPIFKVLFTALEELTCVTIHLLVVQFFRLAMPADICLARKSIRKLFRGHLCSVVQRS